MKRVSEDLAVRTIFEERILKGKTCLTAQHDSNDTACIQFLFHVTSFSLEARIVHDLHLLVFHEL